MHLSICRLKRSLKKQVEPLTSSLIELSPVWRFLLLHAPSAAGGVSTSLERHLLRPLQLQNLSSFIGARDVQRKPIQDVLNSENLLSVAGREFSS
jgi:hypothetical protein